MIKYALLRKTYQHLRVLPLPGSSAAIDRWKDLSTVCVYLFPPSKVTPEINYIFIMTIKYTNFKNYMTDKIYMNSILLLLDLQYNPRGLCGLIVLLHNCLGLGLWCLTPLSTIFQLYRGSQFYWQRKQKQQEKTTNLPKLITCFIEYTEMSWIQPDNFSGDSH